MGRVVYGPGAGEVSGSVGNTKHSRGRYGGFLSIRRRPLGKETRSTVDSRGFMATASRAFGTLTAEERAAWGVWAAQNPVVDRLGQNRVLSAQGAFCELNCRILRCAMPIIRTPPVVAGPSVRVIESVAVSVGPLSVLVRFDDEVKDAGYWVFVWGCVKAKQGQRRWQDAMKLLVVEFALVPGVVDVGPAIEERFGTARAGMGVWVRCAACDGYTGLIGSPELYEGTL